ncbi:hypothetical protein ElyMa_003909900 [Elysia marginata]|uniref:WSC domain-containing protein n=1 Tax=Elysia marginata TaxID=1093978 RepID=A0AAV4FQR5_9GAST|nr:hypothetical protein ElyMa_003909900 [Elysia marginata]
MVVDSILIVLISTALVGSYGEQNIKVCRFKLPGYFIDKDNEAIFQGCFHSKGKDAVLPKEPLINFRSSIDWDKWNNQGYAKDIIEKCGKKAIEKGKAYFGVEFYGECYLGNRPDFSRPQVTDADGCSKFCSYGVGGSSAMVVYKVEQWAPKCPVENVGYHIDETHWAWNRGCYHQNSNSFVFPVDTYINFRNTIDWYDFVGAGHAGSMVRRCGLVALQNNAKFFGVGFFGNCFHGNAPIFVGGEAPCHDDICYWDVGKQTGIMMYRIEDI